MVWVQAGTALLLWGCKPYLDALGAHFAVCFVAEGGVAQGFEDAEGQVLGGTESAREGRSEEASPFNELHERVRYLQEQVVDLYGVFVVTVCVFELVPTILLDIESFVLNFPSKPSSFVGQFHDVVLGDPYVGHPLEFRDFLLFFIAFALFLAGACVNALQDRKRVFVLVGIDVVDAVGPAKALGNLFLFANAPRKAV